MEHLRSTSGLSGGVNLSSQASQEKNNQQTNTPPTTDPEYKSLCVPPTLWPLVEILRSYRMKGNFKPLRTLIAVDLSKKPVIYKNAGVTKFSQYVGLALKEGLVELGGANGTEWIRLMPKWYGAWKLNHCDHIFLPHSNVRPIECMYPVCIPCTLIISINNAFE